MIAKTYVWRVLEDDGLQIPVTNKGTIDFYMPFDSPEAAYQHLADVAKMHQDNTPDDLVMVTLYNFNWD